MKKKIHCSYSLRHALCALLSRSGAAGRKNPAIGFMSGKAISYDLGSIVKAFRQGLRDLGYVEGKNIVLEFRYAEGNPDRIPELVAELVQLKVDMLVTGE